MDIGKGTAALLN